MPVAPSPTAPPPWVISGQLAHVDAPVKRNSLLRFGKPRLVICIAIAVVILVAGVLTSCCPALHAQASLLGLAPVGKPLKTASAHQTVPRLNSSATAKGNTVPQRDRIGRELGVHPSDDQEP